MNRIPCIRSKVPPTVQPIASTEPSSSNTHRRRNDPSHSARPQPSQSSHLVKAPTDPVTVQTHTSHGAWCMCWVVLGAWCMCWVVLGAWCMCMGGAWCMVHGIGWCPVLGVWSWSQCSHGGWGGRSGRSEGESGTKGGATEEGPPSRKEWECRRVQGRKEMPPGFSRETPSGCMRNLVKSTHQSKSTHDPSTDSTRKSGPSWTGKRKRAGGDVQVRQGLR
jgi:hypothetical protein